MHKSISLLALIFIVALSFLLTGCGRSSRDNDVVGQVKKVQHATPIICPNHDVLDLSLGVMRNGVGSMSTQDQIFYISNPAHSKLLQEAQNSGKLVKIISDTWRWRICYPEKEITSVEILKD